MQAVANPADSNALYFRAACEKNSRHKFSVTYEEHLAEGWLDSVSAFHKYYGIAVGSESALVNFQESRIKSGVKFKHPHKWIRGVHSSRLLFGT